MIMMTTDAAGSERGGMKAITLRQPEASLVADGRKTAVERPKAPPGELVGQRIAVCAGAKIAATAARQAGYESVIGQDYAGRPIKLWDCPTKAVVCTAVLEGAEENADAKWDWRLGEIVRLGEPVPATGKAGLWDWPGR